MSSEILVIGKIATRLRFSVSTDFSKLTESEIQCAGNAQREYDGMASNIAYGLSVLGKSPIIISVVGKDFECYQKPYFEKLGVVLKLFQDIDRETACDYHLTDENNNYIVLQQNNSYDYIAEYSLESKLHSDILESLKVVFVGTGKVEADIRFLNFLYETNKNIPTVYSPDGNIVEVSQWRFNQLLERISILICKESELQLLEKKAQESRYDFLNKFPRLKYIISMESRSKVVVHSKDLKIKVTDGPITDEITTEGWEDAFRAGLLFSVSKRKPIEEALKLAASLASYYVESQGHHKYSPSIEQIQLRAFEVRTIKKEKVN